MSYVIEGLDNIIIDIRCNEKDLKFVLSCRTTIGELKQKIKDEISKHTDKKQNVRLIYCGRLLTPNSKTLADFNIVPDNDFESTSKTKDNNKSLEEQNQEPLLKINDDIKDTKTNENNNKDKDKVIINIFEDENNKRDDLLKEESKENTNDGSLKEENEESNKNTKIDTTTKQKNNNENLKQYIIHCVISEFISDEEHNPEEQQIRRTVGFDRLLETGFSQDEVNIFRRQFHLLRDTYNMTNEQTRQLEEEWLENQRNDIITTNGQGSSMIMSYDFLIGLVVGMFGGLISLILAPAFDKKKLLGLYIGIFSNVFIGLQRMLYD